MKFKQFIHLWLIALVSCGYLEPEGEEQAPKLVKYQRQARFKPDDFTFVKCQEAHSDGRGELWGTCLRVPFLDAKNRTWDCGLGVLMPRHPSNERWPRVEEEAARYAARSANAVRKGLKDFVNADVRTCRAFQQQMTANSADSCSWENIASGEEVTRYSDTKRR